MSALFCCSSISPFRPRRLDHEAKFGTFMRWADLQTTALVPIDDSLVSNAPYAVQLVKQINYGPQESIRYFVPANNGSDFAEATEDDLLKSNFEKLNSYKNFRCGKHNRFFEVNLYQKNPTNTHHWRVNLARPSRDIDLAFRPKDPEAESSNAVEKLAGQEEKQELLPSDIKAKTSSPQLRVSLSQALQEADVASGPGPGEPLDRCQRGHDHFQGDGSNRHDEEAHDLPNEKDCKESLSTTRQLGYDDHGHDDDHDSDDDHNSDYDHYSDYDHDFDYDREPMKDFTACDQECGYCGNCDY